MVIVISLTKFFSRQLQGTDMKTRSHTLTAITSTLILATFIFGLFPAAAVASNNHYKLSFDKARSDKYSFEKNRSKENRSGKQCAKNKKGCDNSLSVPLYVKSNERVGKVTVRLEGGDLKVTYQVNDGWYIKQTNLDVSDNYNGLPLKADGSPNIEANPYKSKHFTPVKSADYTISASQWPLGTDLYVAAQAIVINKTLGKCEQRSASTHSRKSHKDFEHKISHGDKSLSKKGHGKNDREDRDDFYGKKSGNNKLTHAGYDDDGHDHGYKEGYKNGHKDDHDNEHHDSNYQENSYEMEAWAVVEKFPGQQTAGYFIYKLESCDPVQQSNIRFSDSIYTVNEEGPAAVITVVRSGNLDLAASVEYTTVDGSAVNGADYEFTNGVLNFAPGQTSAQFEVTPIDDSEVESVETLSLQLSNPLGAELGQQKIATLQIEDNDLASTAVIAIDRIEPNPVDESATVIIYVTRTGNTNVDATVEFGTIDGTAIGSTQCGAPASPIPFDYEQVGGTLFFDAGISELSIEVTTCNNNPRNDTDETFDIEIYNPMGAELADDGDGNPNSNSQTITIIEGS
jgi:hypothetical protein